MAAPMSAQMKRGLALIAVVALAVVALVWMRMTSLDVTGPGRVVIVPTSPARAAGSGGVGPVGERGGVPVGWSHDEAGARAAAVTYVGLGGRLAVAGPLTRLDMVLGLSTRRYGSDLAARANREFAELLAKMGELGIPPAGLVWSEHPLTVRTETLAAARVRASVWSVLVFAARDRSVPRQVWRTFTVEVLWEDGDWRVDDWATAIGPSPSAPPEAEVASAATISEVASWPAAQGGR
jgi:hypothetical protein